MIPCERDESCEVPPGRLAQEGNAIARNPKFVRAPFDELHCGADIMDSLRE
jgi:hypothetical protein